MSDLPNNNTTTANISTDGVYYDSIEVIYDLDWVRIDVTNEQSVQVNLNGDSSSGSALSDPYLRIYDDTGAQVTFDDDGGFGRNSQVIFTATYTGSYFIEAAAYDDGIGDYEISTQEPPLPAGPLTSLYWGVPIDVQNNVVQVYFAPDGETYDGYTSEGFNVYEKAQFVSAMTYIADRTGLDFNIVTDVNDADTILVLDLDELSSETNPILGYFNPPGTSNAGVGVFNGDLWDRAADGDLERGGYGYVTIVHELLHGLGMSHPHDTGGTSSVMDGVTVPFNSFGNSDLNQGIYTTMSYNSGFANGPSLAQGDPSFDYGYQAGPMALDLAVLQALYGTGGGFRAGNTVYDLPDRFDQNTSWQAIWDTGGTDEIRYNGSRDVTIDLREATLNYEVGGGGFISAAEDTRGGYTIAHGVVIENATGDGGDDRLVGNRAGNELRGNDGNDTAYGRDGNDTMYGGNGRDYMSGGRDDDLIWGGNGTDRVAGGGGRDTLRGGNGNDEIIGGTDVDTLFGGNHDDSMYGGSNTDRMQGDNGNDRLFGGTGSDTLRGEDGDDRLFGGRDNDVLFGGNGHDFIKGGAGQDRVQGNGGQDTFYFRSLDDVDRGSLRRDIIGDFTNDVDTLDLSHIDADTTTAGDQAFDLIGRAGFSDAGQLRLQWSDGRIVLQADVNGDGIIDFEIELRNLASIQDNDIIL